MTFADSTASHTKDGHPKNHDAGNSGRPRPAGLFRRAGRYVRYRLVTPMLRARHPAEYTARSVLVGIICGLLPIIGQSSVVLAVWLVARRCNWGFNLVLAVLWTFISNPLTAPFMFYGFYVTGQVMMGHWHNLSGFTSFVALAKDLVSEELSLGQQAKLLLDTLFLDWYFAMCLGFVPWGVLCGWLGYRWSLKAIMAYRHMREKRMQRRRAQLAAEVMQA